jgi:LacI family transcriptional regulator
MSSGPSPRPASVKDVAALAGVSLGTVSNVLNRPERVSAPTRRKVEDALSRLGFVRNESARQLRAGQSRTIAYVVLDAANPFFTDVALGVEDVAESADLSLYLCNSHQEPAREAQYLVRLEQQRVQGVLLTPLDATDRLIHELPSRGTPVVLVDRTLPGRTHCSVSVDDRLGGRLALDHLIERGHRRIAFVGGPARIGQVRDRREGAIASLRDAALPADALVEVWTDALTVDEGRTAASRIAGMPASGRPTAAFCANDLLALGLLQGCVEQGVEVPGELAVVGYDDIEFASAAAVPLTSVRQPRRELGRAAARLLLDESNNPEHEHEQLEFVPELIARASTRLH